MSPYLPLAGVVGLEAAWLASRGRITGPLLWLPLLTCVAAHAALVVQEHRRPRLGARAVVVAAVVVGLVAVVAPPFGSRDVFLYGIYGRMVEHYHASPYVHLPRNFPGDPLLEATSPKWHSTRSNYGPLFTAVSAAGASVYGASPWAARTWFQVLNLLALLAIVLALARRRVSSSVLLAVALAPPLLAVVNNAHNDLLVGLLVLVGVLLALEGRAGLAGVALGAACLIKVLALPLVAGVVVAYLLKKRWRAAATTAVVTLGLLVVGYGAAGGAEALEPLGQHTAVTTRLSVWYAVQPLVRAVIDSDFGVGHIGRATMVQVALAAAVAVTIAFWVRNRSGGDPAAVMVAPMVVTLLLAAYALPAYAAIALPAVALSSSRRFQVIAFSHASVYLVAYVAPLGHHPVLAPPFASEVRRAVPWICLALAVAFLAIGPARPRPAPSTEDSAV